jgi:hypothetical protein
MKESAENFAPRTYTTADQDFTAQIFERGVPDPRARGLGIGLRGPSRVWKLGSNRDGFSMNVLGKDFLADVDLPIVSLINVAVTPVFVFALGLVLAIRDGDAISGSHVILAILTSVISALVFRGVNFYRSFGRYPIRIALPDILLRWSIVAATVGLIVYAADFHSPHAPVSVEMLIVGAALAPLVLLSAHMLARAVVRSLVSSRNPVPPS